MDENNNINIRVTKAKREDLSEILKLQYLAYGSEAKQLNDTDIQPLKQTIDQVEMEFEKGIILKAVTENNCIIGSVRCRRENDSLFIGKLFVHPDWRKKGIGTRLINEIELTCPHKRCELFTNSKSISNLHLYKSLGYREFKREKVSEALTLVYLEKIS